MIFLSIVIRSWAGYLFFVKFLIKSCLIVFKCSWRFLILSLLLLSVFLLNLFNYIIVLEVLFINLLWQLLKSFLSYTEPRFSNYKIWILLLFFYYLCCNVIVYKIVGSWRWVSVGLSNTFTSGTWFENRIFWFLIDDIFRVITSWARLISWYNILIFASCLCRSKLPSISSLDFIN